MFQERKIWSRRRVVRSKGPYDRRKADGPRRAKRGAVFLGGGVGPTDRRQQNERRDFERRGEDRRQVEQLRKAFVARFGDWIGRAKPERDAGNAHLDAKRYVLLSQLVGTSEIGLLANEQWKDTPRNWLTCFVCMLECNEDGDAIFKELFQ
jgi:hypothetical protein